MALIMAVIVIGFYLRRWAKEEEKKSYWRKWQAVMRGEKGYRTFLKEMNMKPPEFSSMVFLQSMLMAEKSAHAHEKHLLEVIDRIERATATIERNY